jgi:membrane protease YdiL (CAAX protease family)
MSTQHSGGGRFRAYLEFFAAVVYFFIARSLAHHGALRLADEQWSLPFSPLLEQALLVVLLLVGYAGMGFVLDHQLHPIREQGLPVRSGWSGELGLGLAVGWALAVACVLLMAVFGGIAIVLSTEISAWGWLVAYAAFFALVALAEEIVFRGYGFQRLVKSVGPLGASFGFAVFYAVLQTLLPGSSRVSVAVAAVLTLLLSAAYLRTRALWVSWGINFAWKASRALLFGLAVSGENGRSPVVQGNPMGPFWLTGGGYGLDGSWVAFFVLLAAIPVLFRLTRELDYRFNAPTVVSAGAPLDVPARNPYTPVVTRAASPRLVQILPAAAPPSANLTPPSPGQPPTAG